MGIGARSYAERSDSSDSSSSDASAPDAHPLPRHGYGMTVPEGRHVMEGGSEPGWRWEQFDPREIAKWPEPPIGRTALAGMVRPVTLTPIQARCAP